MFGKKGNINKLRNKMDDEPVTILTTSNPGTIGLAKSILNDANIPFMTKNEFTHNLGIGSMGGRYNPMLMEILVRQEDFDTCLELLKNIE